MHDIHGARPGHARPEQYYIMRLLWHEWASNRRKEALIGLYIKIFRVLSIWKAPGVYMGSKGQEFLHRPQRKKNWVDDAIDPGIQKALGQLNPIY